MTASNADVFANLLRACKVERAVTASFELQAPWVLRSEGTEGVLIRISAGAPYWLKVQSELTQVQAGDVVMLARGTAHSIAYAPDDWGNAQAFADILPPYMDGPHGTHPLQIRHGGGGAATHLLTLHLWLNPLDAQWVDRQLPPLILLRARSQPLVAALAGAMELLVQDSLAQKPGWQLSAARMGDLLLVHLVGEHWQQRGAAPPFWASEPGIARVLQAMRERPQEGWTLHTMAQLAAMSRTVFVERFRGLLGQPPMQYLTSLRMQRAAELLRQSGARSADVAEAVGYASEKAFGRAFVRAMGATPAQFQRGPWV